MTRRPTVKFLIYLFPALMDMVVASIMFACPQLLAELGASPKEITSLLVVWGVVYALLCPFVGRLTNARNASWLALSSCLLMAVCACSFALLPSLWPMYGTMMVLSVATAFFFTPFQVFMKAVHGHQAKDLAHSVGLYTFAWCTGFACGPFVAAWVWNSAGWKAFHALNALLSVTAAVGLLLMRHYARSDAPRADGDAQASPPVLPDSELAGRPDLAWLGWVAAGTACLVMSMMRSSLFLSGRLMDISRVQVGTVLSIMFVSASLAGLALAHSRTWMYRAVPVALFGLLGLAGLALLPLASVGTAFVMFCAAAVCLGFYTGSFSFYLVFHALSHPERSAKYVAINEAVVGATHAVGPAITGMIWADCAPSRPYVLGICILAPVLIFQTVVHVRVQRRMSEAASPRST